MRGKTATRNKSTGKVVLPSMPKEHQTRTADFVGGEAEIVDQYGVVNSASALLAATKQGKPRTAAQERAAGKL
jgi:hypothetical protein